MMSGPSLPPHNSIRKNISIEIPPASSADDDAFVREIASVINIEYSWGEAGVVRDGTQRVTLSEVKEQLRARHFSVAFLTSPDGRREAIGCIYVKKLNATHGTLGLLAVRSEHHGTGLARDLVRYGEELCRRTFGLKVMQIELLVPTTVKIAHKVRLQAWYEKMGYVVVAMGDFAADYPHMVPLLLGPTDYRVFEKRLDGQAFTSQTEDKTEAKL
ncbi:hypothetical protein O1611_g5328 [Lasiodiplodia mahajangana]|uniref:Uncharacterized protein n=1 Tax=Lasiodiplodia mahajangana TaxID=1108764 RepID=A0ACC2JLN1_9PEZI|nr:hypothetical protein O1611_g5328 [Lasiodiplodia mahajangana]